MSKITYIDQAEIKNKRILLRVDFNVTLNPDYTIADDERIRQAIPTIKYLLKHRNKIILVSHLDRPKGRNPKLSLKIVCRQLSNHFPHLKIKLVDDFLTEKKETFTAQKPNEIFVLENIRYYPEEKSNTNHFSQKLAALADIYVNDAFGVSHRPDASVVGVPHFLPSFGGLLLKKEIRMISKVMDKPEKPVVAIIGGAKISTKIHFIDKLLEIADQVLIGGGLANTFLCAKGIKIGKSFCEYEQTQNARKLLFLAKKKKTMIITPEDVVVAKSMTGNDSRVIKTETVQAGDYILDIGPETQAQYGAIIAQAKTIIWNGPVGYIENPAYRRGTDFIYYAITHNPDVVSIVGGGDTLAAISKKEYLDKITHISTGGGAMLEFIEKGTLPGIKALKSKT